LKILLEVMVLHVELFRFAMQGDFGLNRRKQWCHSVVMEK